MMGILLTEKRKLHRAVECLWRGFHNNTNQQRVEDSRRLLEDDRSTQTKIIYSLFYHQRCPSESIKWRDDIKIKYL